MLKRLPYPVIWVELEYLDPSFGDEGSADPAEHFLGLSAEHHPCNDLDPAVLSAVIHGGKSVPWQESGDDDDEGWGAERPCSPQGASPLFTLGGWLVTCWDCLVTCGIGKLLTRWWNYPEQLCVGCGPDHGDGLPEQVSPQ